MLRLVLDMPRSWCDARSGRLDLGREKPYVVWSCRGGGRPTYGDLGLGTAGRAAAREFAPSGRSVAPAKPVTMAGPIADRSAEEDHMQFEEFVHEVLAAGARPTSHVPAP